MFKINLTTKDEKLGEILKLIKKNHPDVEISTPEYINAPAKLNGHAVIVSGHIRGKAKQRATRRFSKSGMTGQEIIMHILKGGPKTAKQIRTAFKKDGLSPVSVNAAVQHLRKDKKIVRAGERGEGYTLPR